MKKHPLQYINKRWQQVSHTSDLVRLPGKIAYRLIGSPLRERQLKQHITHLHGSQTIPSHVDELVVLCLVRDGELYMRSFVEHYFALGAKHIVFLDNGSIDSTIKLAQTYPNVTILSTNLPYKIYHILMKRYLIQRFGLNRWSLLVDIDELFDYAYSDEIDLTTFLCYLREGGYTTIVTQMLDMFADEPLASQVSTVDDLLWEKYPYYDISNITKVDYYLENKLPHNHIKLYYGGIRETLFNTTGVYLTKHPLVFYNKQMRLMHHNAHDIYRAKVADITGVLLHYKFLSDFSWRVQRAVREENYYQNSVEYKKYYDRLQQEPNLNPKTDMAQKLTNVNELLDDQFLLTSKEFQKLRC